MNLPNTPIERLMDRATEFGLSATFYQAAGGWLFRGEGKWQLELIKWASKHLEGCKAIVSAEWGAWVPGTNQLDQSPQATKEASRLYGKSLFIQP